MQRCVGEARERVFDTLMKMRKNTKRVCLLQRNATYHVEKIMVIVKVEKKEEKRRATEIANTESMNAEKMMEIEAKIERRKTDRMTTITRETSMMNEERKEEKRSDGTGPGTVIREEIKAKTGRKEEAKGTIITIGIDIAITRRKGLRKMKTGIGINHTSIRGNGEEKENIRYIRKINLLIKKY